MSKTITAERSNMKSITRSMDYCDIPESGFTQELLDLIGTLCFRKDKYEPKVFCSVDNSKKFVNFSKDRIRTVPSEIWKGLYTARYLTTIGLEIEIVPIKDAEVWDLVDKVAVMGVERELME